MRLMPRGELAGWNENELSALFQAVAKNLVLTEWDRRDGLAKGFSARRQGVTFSRCFILTRFNKRITSWIIIRIGILLTPVSQAAVLVASM